MEISEGEEDDTEWKSPVAPSDPHKVIVHFDLDCFYAQVEMIRNPSLRNVPLGVQQKNIIVTCNYVARERGVTKLMSVTDAKEKCPDLVLVKGEDLTHYREMSYRVTELLLSFCPLVERLGFDENFMDITEMVGSRLQQSNVCSFKGHIYNNSFSEDKARIYPWLAMGSQIAAEFREAIYCKLGLTGCAGIATNKLLAKLVSGTFKPNQQTTLLTEDVSNLIGSLDSLRKIPGIGHQTFKRLQALGITSIKHLELFPLDNLVTEFGESSAKRLKSLARGIDDSCVAPTGPPQSLSDEDSFKKMSSTKDVVEKIQELLTSLVERMHKDGRQPHTFRLTIRRYATANKWFSRESRQCPIPSHIGQKISAGSCDDAVIPLRLLAMKLFHKMVEINKAFHLTLLNVCFCNLRDGPSASGKCSLTSFFTSNASLRKTQTYTSQSQVDSNSKGKRCTKEELLPHNSSVQQISQEAAAAAEERAASQPVRCGLPMMDNSFSLDCPPEGLEEQQDLSNPDISCLPPHIDPEVYKCLPEEIQKELLSSDSYNSTLIPFTHSLSKGEAFQETRITTPCSMRPSGSVPGDLNTDECVPAFSRGKLPGNVDPTVFAELPPEVQKELMSEWRQEKPFLKTPPAKKHTSSVTGKDKKATGKNDQSNSLLKYFKPH